MSTPSPGGSFPRRRRHHSSARWSEVVSQYLASDGSLTQKEFAASLGVSYDGLKRHLQDFRQEDCGGRPSTPRVVEVHLQPEPAATPSASPTLAWFPGGAAVEVVCMDQLASLLVRFAELRGC